MPPPIMTRRWAPFSTSGRRVARGADLENGNAADQALDLPHVHGLLPDRGDARGRPPDQGRGQSPRAALWRVHLSQGTAAPATACPAGPADAQPEAPRRWRIPADPD